MINKTLDYYSFKNPTIEFLRHNENMTYKITDDTKSYVLRIHSPIEGYDLDLLRMGKNITEQIAGEMELLQLLDNKGDLKRQLLFWNG